MAGIRKAVTGKITAAILNSEVLEFYQVFPSPSGLGVPRMKRGSPNTTSELEWG